MALKRHTRKKTTARRKPPTNANPDKDGQVNPAPNPDESFPDLHLVSPRYMRGHDVEIAQRALNHGKLGDFYDGPIDGVFGPHTANSTRKAKDHLGYPEKDINRRFDSELLDYLQGHKALSARMKDVRQKRAKARRAQAKEGSVFPKALALARKDIGIKESPPNSNNVVFTRRWYRTDHPPVSASWCVIWASEKLDDAGSDTFQEGLRWSYVPSILAAAHEGVGGMRVVNEDHARHCKTDLALWNFPGSDHHPNHGSFVVEITGDTVRSIDGNTSGDGSQSNGGEVMIRERSISYVEAFVHISE